MYEDDRDLELDAILSILENPIRRKILMKLARDANYPLQLSKELNVSQQAIMKHLKVLEDGNFVSSFEERSDKGGPPRKIYAPRKRYCVRIDIGPNTYDEEYYSYKSYDIQNSDDEHEVLGDRSRIVIKGKVTGEMKSEIVAAIPAFADPVLEKMRMELEDLVAKPSAGEKASDIKDLISDINMELVKLERKRKRLLAIRERTYQESNMLISYLSKDILEKDILSLYINEGIKNTNKISERLNIRISVVENILRRFQYLII